MLNLEPVVRLALILMSALMPVSVVVSMTIMIVLMPPARMMRVAAVATTTLTSASMAAALSLSWSLRAQMPARVINVFPGPLETERYRTIPMAKLHPTALARAITKSLQDSVEDVYPGDVAQEWFARWRENPKVLEREIAQ